MSKKYTVISRPITGLDEPWSDDSKREAHDVTDVETFLKQELRERTPDTELDPESDRPVANSAVAPKLRSIPMRGEWRDPEGDSTTGKIVFFNDEGDELFTVDDIEAGGGGAGGADSARSLLTLDVAPVVRAGDAVELRITYLNYRRVDTERVPTGQPAEEITVSITNGSQERWTTTLRDVQCGTTTVVTVPDGGFYNGKNLVSVRATVVDPDTGERKTPNTSATVTLLALSLASTFSIAASNSAGGYAASDTFLLPFSVSGAGAKRVTLYIDGAEAAMKEITRSGETFDNFTLTCGAGSPLAAAGRHTLQMVAVVEESGVTVTSQSLYFEVWRTDPARLQPHVCVALVRPDGRIFAAGERPVLLAKQFEEVALPFTAYTQSGPTTRVSVSIDGGEPQQQSVDRSLNTFVTRFTEAGEHSVTLTPAGGEALTVGIEAEPSKMLVEETKAGLVLKLSATGRSNSETSRGEWTPETGDAPVSIEGVAFGALDGWDGTSLRLRPGGKVTIGHTLFDTDIKRRALTFEVALRVSDILDPDAEVLTCYDPSTGSGIRITASEAAYLTGRKTTYDDEDGVTHERDVKLSSTFPDGEWQRITLTMADNTAGSLDARRMELYMNGDRSAADIYETSFTGRHTTPAPIVIGGEGATVEVRSLSVYHRFLSDDEVLDNCIASAATLDEMQQMYERNDVLDSAGDYDITRLISERRGVIKIIRKPTVAGEGPLDDMFRTNNKKADFFADIIFTSPFGPDHDFVIEGALIRIQGTSSTLYPVKNIRIYLLKAGKIKGNLVDAFGRWPLRPGAVAIDMVCAKADYVDSSMSLNTGGAKLFNALMLAIGALTPPQKHQQQRGEDVTARTAIDGYPVDIFLATDSTSPAEYLGQYNLNNEKSGIAAILGFTGIEGYTPSCPLVLETLNNFHAACLFQSDSAESLFKPLDSDPTLTLFDSGMEVNYAVDASGAELSDGTYLKLTSKAQTAIRNLFKFIRECALEGSAPDPSDLSTFVSPKFVREASQHFDLDFLCAYYHEIFRRAGVDQLAKNILLSTWDGAIWYPLYYDGDTALGKRNDIFLKYPYNITRDTRDPEADKYAFEGHDSWLWCLLLANFSDRLADVADRVSKAQPASAALEVYIDEQSGHWSERAFNRSGYMKYIRPATQDTYGRRWSFLYGLQGSNTPHRKHFIQNRYKLFDALWATETFRSDYMQLYLARSASDGTDTMRITAADIYSFGYGTVNTPREQLSGVVEAGSEVTLSMSRESMVNDPVALYGVSKMRSLTLGRFASRVKNGLNFSGFKMLRSLDLSVADGCQPATGWNFQFGAGLPLQHLSLRGQTNAATGSNASGVIDLSQLTALESVDLRGCTSVRTVTFAEGAPLSEVHLPAGVTRLELRGHATLTLDDITCDDWSTIESLVLLDCPRIDFTALLRKCPGITRMRVNGIDAVLSPSWFDPYKALHGFDAEGADTDYCAFVGRVVLDAYLEADELAALRDTFAELQVVNCPWTVVKIDESVAEPASISNLDNLTGYDYDNDYQPSGHVKALLAARHRVGMKVVKTGTAVVCPMDDDNSTYWSDGTEAWTNQWADYANRGDFMVYEPARRYKGVTDLLNDIHYDCFNFGSDFTAEDWAARGTKLFPDAMEQLPGHGIRTAFMAYPTLYGKEGTDGPALIESEEADTYIADIPAGTRRLRWPSIISSSLGAVLLDDDNNVLAAYNSTDTRATEFGLFTDVPDGAVRIAFCVPAGYAVEYLWATESTNPADLEPRCIEIPEKCVSVDPSVFVNDRLSLIPGIALLAQTWDNWEQTLAESQLEMLKYSTYRDILRLYLACYGHRKDTPTGVRISVSDAKYLQSQDYIKYGMRHGVYYGKKQQCYLGYNLLHDLISSLIDGSASGSDMSVKEEDGTTRIIKNRATGNYITNLIGGVHGDIFAHRVGGEAATRYTYTNSTAATTSGRIRVGTNDGRWASQFSSAVGTWACNARLQFVGEIIWEADPAEYMKYKMI